MSVVMIGVFFFLFETAAAAGAVYSYLRTRRGGEGARLLGGNDGRGTMLYVKILTFFIFSRCNLPLFFSRSTWND